MIPAVSAAAYDAARHRAAFLDRSHRGRIVVSGSDRASYLQGLLTNDIVALKAGQGCYAAYLTAQGRMIADLDVYELGDVHAADDDRRRQGRRAGEARSVHLLRGRAARRRHRHVRADRDRRAGGGRAWWRRSSAACPSEALRDMPEHGNVARRVGRRRGDRHARRRHRRTGVRSVRRTRAERRAEGGAAAPRARSSSTRRPRRRSASRRACRCFGRDMDEETIPLEAGIESRAISFTKGCYVGQEVIIRVLHRGHGRVARKLVGLTLDGDRVPAAGADDPQRRPRDRPRDEQHGVAGADSGRSRSAYVHRDFLEPGTTGDGRRPDARRSRRCRSCTSGLKRLALTIQQRDSP